MVLMVSFGVTLLPGQATEEHLLQVYQALATSSTVEISQVTYLTWYGAMEETTLEAVGWPAHLESPHEDASKEDVNWASVLGIKLRLNRAPESEQWRLTVDLTGMKAVPQRLRAERLDEEVDRAFLLQRVLEAAEKNLNLVGVFDCQVSIRGEQAHEDLKDFVAARELNVLEDVWGPWKYKALRKTYPDGDLHQLAAQSLVHAESLRTIFFVLSSEDDGAEARLEGGVFLRELLARVGDEVFARVLGNSETLVQERVLSVLSSTPPHDPDLGVDWRAWFPRTAGIGAKR